MKRQIKLTESQLYKVIIESVKSILLNETKQKANPIEWTITNNNDPEKLKRLIASKHKYDIDDLKIVGNKIIYKPSKKGKTVKNKTKLVKENGMSNEDFFQEVLKYKSPEVQKKSETKEGEIWKPLPNVNRYFKGELDPSQIIEVSNFGRVRCLNVNDGLKSKLLSTPFIVTRNEVQVHINDKENNLHTTGVLHNMVYDTFGEDAPFDYQKYKVKFKDGNASNCRIDNLYLAPRSKKNI